MSWTMRLVPVLACLTLVLAALAGGPGTGALLSDSQVAAGNVSTDIDSDRVSIVGENDDGNTSSTNTSVDEATNETESNTTDMNETDSNTTDTNETAETEERASSETGDEDDDGTQSMTGDDPKADDESKNVRPLY